MRWLLLFLTFLPPARADIVGGEYFINEDPGIGQATALPAPASNEASLNLPPAVLASLPDGFHQIGIRYRDEEGHWGQTRYQSFALPLPPDPGSLTVRSRLHSGEITAENSRPWNEAAQLPAPTTHFFPEDLAVSTTLPLEVLFEQADGTIVNREVFDLEVRSFQDDFRHHHFTEEERAEELISGEEADPDEDGLSNFLERALGFNPRVPNVGEAGQFLHISRTGSELSWPSPAKARFAVDDGTLLLDDLRFTLMESPDLRSWTPVPLSEPESEGTTQTISPPPSARKRRFFQLRIMKR